MQKLLFFSNNQNKITEVNDYLLNSSFNILNLNKFRKIKSPKEIGKNFNENAKIKSLYGFNKFNIACFADDSGICINAMNGKPGINSKQFMLKYKSQNEALNEIINIAKIKNNFTASFQTSICLTTHKDKHIFFNGKVEGYISKKIKGKFGFGYDPIFIPKGGVKTYAEMSLKYKNSVSHRAIAIKKLLKYLICLV